MLAAPYELVELIAMEYGAVDCFWRESDRAFTGCVAEVWFLGRPWEFAQKWARVVGYPIRSRSTEEGPGNYMVSVPVAPGI
jgi:hypothetical protein